MFEVSLGIIPVNIFAKHPVTGEECKLVHHVCEPTSAEWKEYNRRDSGTEMKRNKLKFEPKTLEAAEWLYDKISQKAEGYTKDGQDIMTLDNWKSLVPVLHKSITIKKFSEVWADDEEDSKK